MKKIILIIIVIVIAWFGYEFFINKSSTSDSDSDSNIVDNNHVLNPSIKTENITEENNEKRYGINIDLAVVENIDNPEKANAFIKNKVDEIVNKFKENIDDWEVSSDLDSEMKSGLWIKFEEHLLTKDYVSLRLTVSEYLIGVAHPNNYSFPLNYNLKELDGIKLDDIFNVNQEEYLSRISKLALIDLEDQFKALDIDPDTIMFKSGVEPKIENFSNFNLTKNGIIFNFDQYQIAPYAAGEFHVIIPYEELTDIVINIEN